MCLNRLHWFEKDSKVTVVSQTVNSLGLKIPRHSVKAVTELDNRTIQRICVLDMHMSTWWQVEP